jgi:ribosomal protein S18 acetylase RimI-like enzyme
MVTRGNTFRYDEVEGFIVKDQEDEVMGLITYVLRDQEMEIISLNSFHEDHGIGTILLKRVIDIVEEERVSRLFLITTNNNIRAQEFYRKRGFEIVQIHKDAIRKSRDIKPEIPLYDENGMEIRDEIEMDYRWK